MARPAHDRPTLCAQLGAFRLTALAAEGGMGVVYRGFREGSGAPVAVKVLHPDMAEDELARERFFQEARIGARIDHPNVVRTLDLYRDDLGRLHLVTEWLEGETLEARMTRGPLPPDEALRITLGLCDGLSAAHRAGVIHRDIKPSNVFLARHEGDPAGVVPKLFDFGIARLAGRRLTRAGVIVGTPAYMAPEQLVPGWDVTERSDVRAVALLLYQMLTGWNPFLGASTADSLRRVLEVEAPPAPGVAPALLSVLRRALSRDPGLRPASAEALREELLRALRFREARTVLLPKVQAIRGAAPRRSGWARLVAAVATRLGR